MSKLQGIAKKQSVEDKTTREILNQINEKLHKYKKSNYSKREIIWQKAKVTENYPRQLRNRFIVEFYLISRINLSYRFC